MTDERRVKHLFYVAHLIANRVSHCEANLVDHPLDYDGSPNSQAFHRGTKVRRTLLPDQAKFELPSLSHPCQSPRYTFPFYMPENLSRVTGIDDDHETNFISARQKLLGHRVSKHGIPARPADVIRPFGLHGSHFLDQDGGQVFQSERHRQILELWLFQDQAQKG